MEQTKHNLTMEDRGNLQVTGVTDVSSFNENEIRLALSYGGRLTVTGDKLQIVGFDKRTGECRLAGRVNSLKYIDKAVPVAKRFFK